MTNPFAARWSSKEGELLKKDLIALFKSNQKWTQNTISRVGIDSRGLTDLRGLDLSGENLANADLSCISLDYAILDRGNFEKANFYSSSLCGASVNNALLIGANLVQVTAKSTVFDLSDLSNSYAMNSDFAETSFRHCNMQKIALSYSQCHRANFSSANLLGADLFKADFSGAIFDN